jgi:hypothetical protein
VSICFALIFQLTDDRSAIVWGASAKHSRGQKVGLDHILEDEDGEIIFDYPPAPSDTSDSRPHFQEVTK